MVRKLIIYIDTAIARDWTHNRNKESIELLNQIKNKKLKCLISVFGLMELADLEQEELFLKKKTYIEREDLDTIFSKRKRRDLNKEDLEKSSKYLNDFWEDYKKIVNLADLNQEGWGLALNLGANSNLNATDVLHLATAWQNKCNILVTRDEFFIKEASKILKKEGIWSSFKICNPKKALSLLRKIKNENQTSNTN